MKVKSFVDEGEALNYVAKKLGVSYGEAEALYCELGGYQGHAVSFDTRWPNTDRFSVCIQEFMTEHGIQSLQLQFDD